jgi:Helix-turn-helix domain
MTRDKIAFNQALGERLLITRRRLGITEREAAAAAQVSLRTWKKYEAGGGGHMTVPIVCFGMHYGLSDWNWLFCGIGYLPPSRKPRLRAGS